MDSQPECADVAAVVAASKRTVRHGGITAWVQERWGGRIRLLAAFFFGHGLNQAIGLITGFLLLHLLSVEDYAKLSIALGFQFTLVSLTELGISGAIINLVGARGEDKLLIGHYVAASRHLRNLLFLVAVPSGAIAFYYFGTKHSWDLSEQTLLYGAIVVTVFFQASAAWYASPLIIHKQLSTSYRIAAVSAAGRLAAVSGFYMLSLLNAGIVCAVTAATVALQAVLARRAASPFLVESDAVKPEIRRELLRYIGPLAPGVLFFSFQGQVAIFLISLSGTTQSVAEVGALGRLGVLFGVFTALNSAIICPCFARLPESAVKKRYALTMSVATTVCTVLVAGVFLWPEPLLWLLGPKYLHMHKEAVWSVIGASVAYIGGLMYGVNLARKWVFWWGAIVTIAAVLCVQAGMLWCFPVSTALSATVFSAITSGVMMLVQILVAVCGISSRRLSTVERAK